MGKREYLFGIGLIDGVNLGLGSDAIIDWVVQIVFFFTALHLSLYVLFHLCRHLFLSYTAVDSLSSQLSLSLSLSLYLLPDHQILKSDCTYSYTFLKSIDPIILPSPLPTSLIFKLFPICHKQKYQEK